MFIPDQNSLPVSEIFVGIYYLARTANNGQSLTFYQNLLTLLRHKRVLTLELSTRRSRIKHQA